MPKQSGLNSEVTDFLNALKHPLKDEINQLRKDILTASPGLVENIKWNGPNYSFDGNDRITMRVQPPKQIQLIFHRGAKVLALPENKLIDDSSGLLAWKTNDRAVATFRSLQDVISNRAALIKIVNDWLKAASK